MCNNPANSSIKMSFSSIPSFRSGTASPAKVPPTQSSLSPSSLRSESPAQQQLIAAVAVIDNNSAGSTVIPWTTSQGKLYKSVGEEAWKKCEKIVNYIFN